MSTPDWHSTPPDEHEGRTEPAQPERRRQPHPPRPVFPDPSMALELMGAVQVAFLRATADVLRAALDMTERQIDVLEQPPTRSESYREDIPVE